MTINTPRLILRPFCPEDAADILEYLAEPPVNCFADMKLTSLENARAEAQNRSAQDKYYFAVTLKESGKVIGEIWAFPEGHNRDTICPCWIIRDDCQGKGYAFEAAQAFFDYLFNTQNARRLYAYTEDYNIPSQRLCEKLGMRKEGFFKEFISFVSAPDGTPIYENTLQYAILKKEWDNQHHCDF